MRSSSANQTVELAVERARPLLGTTVGIRVAGCAPASAHRAIDAAFATVARVHARMSFHEVDSDLSRLHRARAGTRVVVDDATAHVLREALAFSALSDGAFDVAVAAQLVASGRLPRPVDALDAVADASWRDIEIDADGGVILHRPMWIDLGGIAKGYAVDCAIETLRAHGIAEASVNAGGDLRMLGAGPHQVLIAADETDAGVQPLLEVGEAAVATSGGRAPAGAHLHGRTRTRIDARECVSVVAARCLVADALTKIVLALGEASEAALRASGATAYRRGADGRWSVWGEVA